MKRVIQGMIVQSFPAYRATPVAVAGKTEVGRERSLHLEFAQHRNRVVNGEDQSATVWAPFLPSARKAG